MKNEGVTEGVMKSEHYWNSFKMLGGVEGICNEVLEVSPRRLVKDV